MKCQRTSIMTDQTMVVATGEELLEIILLATTEMAF
jgi:hypothetical protein